MSKRPSFDRTTAVLPPVSAMMVSESCPYYFVNCQSLRGPADTLLSSQLPGAVFEGLCVYQVPL
jgi:hypothetical protein